MRKTGKKNKQEDFAIKSQNQKYRDQSCLCHACSFGLGWLIDFVFNWLISVFLRSRIHYSCIKFVPKNFATRLVRRLHLSCCPSFSSNML